MKRNVDKIRSHNFLVKLTTRILITNGLTTVYLTFQVFIGHKKRALVFTTKLTAIPSRNINLDFDLAFYTFLSTVGTSTVYYEIQTSVRICSLKFLYSEEGLGSYPNGNCINTKHVYGLCDQKIRGA